MKHLQESISAQAGNLLHCVIKKWTIYLSNLIFKFFVNLLNETEFI